MPCVGEWVRIWVGKDGKEWEGRGGEGAYDVAALGGTAGKNEDNARAAGGAAGFEVVTGRGELASFDSGGVLNKNGGEAGSEAGGGEDVEKLHVHDGIGVGLGTR